MLETSTSAPSQPTILGGVTMFASGRAAVDEFVKAGFEVVHQAEHFVRLARDSGALQAYAERTTGGQWRGYIAQMPPPTTESPPERQP